MDSLLVKVNEACHLLGVSRSKFYSLVASGIPRIKIGRSARYRRIDLLAFTEDLAAAAGAHSGTREEPAHRDHVWCNRDDGP
jgi:excisionase family DNA binding protein